MPRYRRSPAGRLLSDAAYIGNRLSWRWSVFLGVFFFVLFYWLVPAWLTAWIEGRQSGANRAIVDIVLARRVHWFQWIGVALALVFAYFAARGYWRARRHTREGERNAGLLARLLARLLD